MSRRRSEWRTRLEYYGWAAAAWIARRTPLDFAMRLSDLVAAIVFALSPRFRRIALVNLRAAFPELGEAERRALAVRSFANLGRSFFEFCRFQDWGRREVARRVRIEGLEHLHAAFAGGRGVIALTAHFGNWELLAHAYGVLEHPLSVVARAQDNPSVDRWFRRMRTLAGNRVLERERAGREILRLLRRKGEMVGILADQHVGAHEAVTVDFFGMPTRATRGLALLAVRTGAPVVPIFLVRDGEGPRHAMVVRPALRFASEGDPEAAVREATQACQNVIEEFVRAYPDQWLWGHRRWKSVPEIAALYPSRKHRRRRREGRRSGLEASPA